jgi:hypothetical protein
MTQASHLGTREPEATSKSLVAALTPLQLVEVSRKKDNRVDKQTGRDYSKRDIQDRSGYRPMNRWIE